MTFYVHVQEEQSNRFFNSEVEAESLDHAVEELVEGFKKHWRRQGIDPVTGKEL